MNRRSVIAALLASVALSAGIGKATAQDGYPSRVIKFIVPFAAGSATDTLARVLGQSMSASLGQSVVVDNMPGASGFLAAQNVARAEPDGYTVLIASNTTHAANQSLFKKLALRSRGRLRPRSQARHDHAGPGHQPFGAGRDGSRS